jgi:stage V sporulation protein SpoVS
MLLSESIGAKTINMVVGASAPEVRAHLDADVHAVGSGQQQPSIVTSALARGTAQH